jgi:hypothetical protein
MTVEKPTHRVAQSTVARGDGAFFSHSENKSPMPAGLGAATPTQPSSATAAGELAE